MSRAIIREKSEVPSLQHHHSCHSGRQRAAPPQYGRLPAAARAAKRPQRLAHPIDRTRAREEPTSDAGPSQHGRRGANGIRPASQARRAELLPRDLPFDAGAGNLHQPRRLSPRHRHLRRRRPRRVPQTPAAPLGTGRVFGGGIDGAACCSRQVRLLREERRRGRRGAGCARLGQHARRDLVPAARARAGAVVDGVHSRRGGSGGAAGYFGIAASRRAAARSVVGIAGVATRGGEGGAGGGFWNARYPRWGKECGAGFGGCVFAGDLVKAGPRGSVRGLFFGNFG